MSSLTNLRLQKLFSDDKLREPFEKLPNPLDFCETLMTTKNGCGRKNNPGDEKSQGQNPCSYQKKQYTYDNGATPC
ncbi:hypothetical protein [Pseudomonas sp. TMB3-21]